MTHITFSAKTLAKPSLEFYSDGAREPRRVTIERCPFKIGRAETSDLRIDSAQVSRDHAEIVDRGGVWFLRDLGSTNGTQVNGKSVSEAMLADGDIVRVAETELTFVASASTKFQRMVTQPIHARDRAIAPLSTPAEIVAARTVVEATLWQAIPIQLSRLTSLERGSTEAAFGAVASGAGTGSAGARHLFRSSHRAGAHYRELFRRRAAELTHQRELATRLFVEVDAIELDSPRQLLESLEMIQELWPTGWELGVVVDAVRVLETARAAEFYQSARNQGLLVAYDEFQGSGAQVTQFEKCPPEYLLLCDSMIKGLTNLAEARQPLRRLESVMAACEELVISPVLPLSTCEATRDACRQLGYDLALRPFGAPAAKARQAAVV